MDFREEHKVQFEATASELGFKEALLGGYYDALASGGQEKVAWAEYHDFGDSRVLYEAELRKDNNGQPFLYGYLATLLETHPIHHGVYGEIDTAQLEQHLKEGKWETDPVVFSELFAQLTELSLSGNSIAKDIAQRLEARYWLGTSANGFINVDSLRARFGRSHYFYCADEPAKVTIEQAYNLMSGRPALRFEEKRKNLYMGYWFGLKRLRYPTIKGKVQFWFEEKRYNDFNAHKLLRELPVKYLDEQSGLLLVRGLMEGKVVTAILEISGVEQPCYIKAAPETNRLSVFDVNGQELMIPKNIKETSKVRKPPPAQKKTGRNP